MNSVNDVELSPAAISLIADVISAQNALLSRERVTHDTAAVVRYLSAAMSSAQARDVEESLVKSKALRLRLIKASSILERLKKSDWSEVLSSATGDQYEAEVAQAWVDLTEEREKNAQAGWQIWLNKGWNHILEQSRLGVLEAQAICADFQDFGARLSQGMSEPRTALARGEASDEIEIITSNPDNLKFRVTLAELTSAGDLEVSVRVLASVNKDILDLENQQIGLALRLKDEKWPIGNAAIKGGHAQWHIKDLQSALALPAGKISGLYLLIYMPGNDNMNELFKLPV